MPNPGLDDLQIEVLHLFFSLPESDGFVLAGGAGLVATGLSLRPTKDLDLFTSSASVAGAGDALEAAAGERGWGTERIQESPTFRRLVIATGDGAQVLVDLAQDSAPLSTATITPLGPTYPPEELAARKILALFGRAALRDFVDVATVAARYDRADLLRLAAEIDGGFDLSVLREMIAALDRFGDDEIREFTDPEPLRAFFSEWATELNGTS